MMTLVRRIESRPDGVQIGVSRSRLSAALAAPSVDLPFEYRNNRIVDATPETGAGAHDCACRCKVGGPHKKANPSRLELYFRRDIRRRTDPAPCP